MSQQETKDMAKNFYRASAADFKKIPGGPVAYWIAPKLGEIYLQSTLLQEHAHSMQGMITGNNDRFLRRWFEVDRAKLSIGCDDINDVDVNKKNWIPYKKGGDLRKWYGNNDFILNWKNEGRDLTRPRTQNKDYYFKPCITWTFISSSFFSARWCDKGFVWDVAGSSAFPRDQKYSFVILALMCSKVGKAILESINPTLNYQVENILALPIHESLENYTEEISNSVSELIKISKRDWDSYETSWDFQVSPLLMENYEKTVLFSYKSLIDENRAAYYRSEVLENNNNELLINLYGLGDRGLGDVTLDEITLESNPHYSYGGGLDSKEIKNIQRSDLMKDLISYAIGCMMGRYSLDKLGLILASQSETLQDYLHQIPESSFAPDDDAILPLTDQEWFTDDATNRFREFVRVAWSDEHLQENLDFVAESLCLNAINPKSGESALDNIRRYLSTQFFKDHLRTYKKRPIYWLFSSGKHKAFECLVYLHRYNDGTLARMRTEYVIPLSAKLNAYAEKLEQDKEASTSAAETKRLEKEIATLHKQQAELAEFDEKLRHFADQRISLDLDDGVKVNYGKFGDLLAEVKAVTGQK